MLSSLWILIGEKMLCPNYDRWIIIYLPDFNNNIPDLDELVLESMNQVLKSDGRGYSWQCNHCGKEDKDKNNMRRHVESHFSFSHTCPYCAKVYKSRPSLRCHISTKHRTGQWFININTNVKIKWDNTFCWIPL